MFYCSTVFFSVCFVFLCSSYHFTNSLRSFTPFIANPIANIPPVSLKLTKIQVLSEGDTTANMVYPLHFPKSKYAMRVDFVLFLFSFCFFLLSPSQLPCYYYKIVRTYSFNPEFLTKLPKQELFCSKKGLREECSNWLTWSYMLTVVIVLKECI